MMMTTTFFAVRTDSSQAFIASKSGTLLKNVLCVLGGVVLLSALAQVSLHLPFTPVPITGQTFGVALIALLWGSRRGVATLASYLGLGALGAPIFASGMSGIVVGPTLGYLVGMLISSFVVGALADRGWAKTFVRAWSACAIGSLIVYTSGVLGLALFVPGHPGFYGLLILGVLPFIPGDLIKTTLAASIAVQVGKKT